MGFTIVQHQPTHYPKTSLSKSKVCPIFTVDLDSEIVLGEGQSELFKFDEHYVDTDHYCKTRSKEVALHFHEINSSSLCDANLIRAEFFGSRLRAVELLDDQQLNSTCVIL